jgi:hypothetical protein
MKTFINPGEHILTDVTLIFSQSQHMQNEQTLQGWMFINHIALQWYQRIELQLKDKKLLSKYSVNVYFQMLLDIRKVKINQTWHIAEIISTVEKFLQKPEPPMT